MGLFSNSTATSLSDDSFLTWHNVASASVSFVNAGQLPVDVTSLNDTLYLGRFNDDINPIIFDTDGSIMDSVFGIGAKRSIIGFAGSAYDGQTGLYVEGEAVMNGWFANNPFTANQFMSTFVHEFGHFIGLDHTQINAQFAGDGNKANDVYIPTMFPTSVDEDSTLNSLNPDDIAAVSVLYPTPAFLATTGSIRGKVIRADSSIVPGAVVIAISTTDSLMNQVSTVTDYFTQATGSYTIAGLLPGTYWVKLEPVRSGFSGASSVGPYAGTSHSLSFQNPVVTEYYNGANESSDPTVDPPDARTPVTVTPNIVIDNINFVANGFSDAPVVNILQYYGSLESGYIFNLPSEYGDLKYAVRSTPGVDAKLERVDFFIYNQGIRGHGTLKISVHQNAAGSLGGIPGAMIGSPTLIPFSKLFAGGFNSVDLDTLNIMVSKNVSFHIAFEVLGNPGDTLAFISDDGTTETDRSSSYYQSGNLPIAWYNFEDANNFGTGFNLVVRAAIDFPTGIREQPSVLPKVYTLYQNYPNPFNPATIVRYDLPREGRVSLRVYDVLGRNVRTLFEGVKAPGTYSVTFDGSGLSSGIYYCVLTAENYRLAKPMVFLK